MYRTAPAGAGGSCREMPVHDASSHSADAARMFAEALTHGHGCPGAAPALPAPRPHVS